MLSLSFVGEQFIAGESLLFSFVLFKGGVSTWWDPQWCTGWPEDWQLPELPHCSLADCSVTVNPEPWGAWGLVSMLGGRSNLEIDSWGQRRNACIVCALFVNSAALGICLCSEKENRLHCLWIWLWKLSGICLCNEVTSLLYFTVKKQWVRLGFDFGIKMWFLSVFENSIVEVKRSYDRFISAMGFPKLLRWNLYLICKMASYQSWKSHNIHSGKLVLICSPMHF